MGVNARAQDANITGATATVSVRLVAIGRPSGAGGGGVRERVSFLFVFVCIYILIYNIYRTKLLIGEGERGVAFCMMFYTFRRDFTLTPLREPSTRLLLMQCVHQ